MVALKDHHVVDIYEQDLDMGRRVATFLAEGLERGEAAVIIATPEHRSLFCEHLADQGIDVAGCRTTGLVMESDAASLLDCFFADGLLDRARFDASVGELLGSAERFPGFRVVGEMVDLLWARGGVMGSLSLESEWNELGRRHDFKLYCCYGAGGICGHEEDLVRLGDLYSEVVSAPAAVSWLTFRKARTFPSAITSPRAARLFVADLLKRWGLEDQIDAAGVVVSELSTNALLHAQSPFEVVVSRRGPALRLAVSDRSGTPPVVRAPSATASSGRGMAIVANLALVWGIDMEPSGKTVWADIPVT